MKRNYRTLLVDGNTVYAAGGPPPTARAYCDVSEASRQRLVAVAERGKASGELATRDAGPRVGWFLYRALSKGE